MRVDVEILGGRAYVLNGEWYSDSRFIQGTLNNTRQVDDEVYRPDPDAALAHGAVKLYGGRVMDLPPVVIPDGVEF